MGNLVQKESGNNKLKICNIYMYIIKMNIEHKIAKYELVTIICIVQNLL